MDRIGDNILVRHFYELILKLDMTQEKLVEKTEFFRK